MTARRFKRTIDWLEGDETLFARLAPEAASSFEASARKLTALASDPSSLKDLAAEAHHLRGVWKPYARVADESLPGDLERAARAGDPIRSATLAKQLAQTLASAADELNAYLTSRKGTAG